MKKRLKTTVLNKSVTCYKFMLLLLLRWMQFLLGPSTSQSESIVVLEVVNGRFYRNQSSDLMCRMRMTQSKLCCSAWLLLHFP